MDIVIGLAVLIIGIFIGYAICMTQWVKELCRQIHENEMVIARLKLEVGGKNGDDRQG